MNVLDQILRSGIWGVDEGDITMMKCPITHDTPVNPVVIYGIHDNISRETYERWAIQKSAQKWHKDPITCAPLDDENPYILVEDSEFLHYRTRREFLELFTEEQIEGGVDDKILDLARYLGGREHVYNCLVRAACYGDVLMTKFFVGKRFLSVNTMVKVTSKAHGRGIQGFDNGFLSVPSPDVITNALEFLIREVRRKQEHWFKLKTSRNEHNLVTNGMTVFETEIGELWRNINELTHYRSGYCVNVVETTPLQIAASNGHVEVIQVIIDDLEYDFEKQGSGLAICLACKFNHLDVVKVLTNDGPVSVDEVNHSDRETPLWFASSVGNILIVDCLIKHGACVHETGESETTPLYIACFKNHLAVVRYLVEEGRANINQENVNGANALHVAMKHRDCKIVDYLLDKGANVNACKKNGEGVIHEAALHNNDEALGRLLLDRNLDLDVNLKTHDGETALDIALKRNNKASAMRLEQMGKRPKRKKMKMNVF